jgi:hypothetical protein
VDRVDRDQRGRQVLERLLEALPADERVFVTRALGCIRAHRRFHEPQPALDLLALRDHAGQEPGRVRIAGQPMAVSIAVSFVLSTPSRSSAGIRGRVTHIFGSEPNSSASMRPLLSRSPSRCRSATQRLRPALPTASRTNALNAEAIEGVSGTLADLCRVRQHSSVLHQGLSCWGHTIEGQRAVPKSCDHCGEPFNAHYPQRQFCS